MWNHGWGHAEMMGWGDGTWPWLMMGTHGLFWLLLIGIAVTALTLLIRSRGRSVSQAGGDGAMIILEARYARGEIERGEYQERKRDLS